MDFRYLGADALNTRCWKDVEQQMRTALAALREQLESPTNTDAATASLRGQIRLLKNMLAQFQADPAIKVAGMLPPTYRLSAAADY